MFCTELRKFITHLFDSEKERVCMCAIQPISKQIFCSLKTVTILIATLKQNGGRPKLEILQY